MIGESQNGTRKKIKDVHKVSIKDVHKKERKIVILEKIRKKEPFTAITLARELNVSIKTLMRDIGELKKQRKIKFVGSKRSGHYELME